MRTLEQIRADHLRRKIGGGRERLDDGNWITVNGTHVMVDKGGSLVGAVGEKISASSKSRSPKNGSSKGNGSSSGGSSSSGSKSGEKHSWSSNETWKPSTTTAVENLLNKPTEDITMSDTRKAIKEYKEEFAKAVERASKDEHPAGPYEIRLDFDRYHKEIAKKMHDIEKNGNKNKMEGRVAIKDAERFLWDGAGCDRDKISW